MSKVKEINLTLDGDSGYIVRLSFHLVAKLGKIRSMGFNKDAGVEETGGYMDSLLELIHAGLVGWPDRWPDKPTVDDLVSMIPLPMGEDGERAFNEALAELMKVFGDKASKAAAGAAAPLSAAPLPPTGSAAKPASS